MRSPETTGPALREILAKITSRQVEKTLLKEHQPTAVRVISIREHSQSTEKVASVPKINLWLSVALEELKKPEPYPLRYTEDFINSSALHPFKPPSSHDNALLQHTARDVRCYSLQGRQILAAYKAKADRPFPHRQDIFIYCEYIRE